MTMPIKLPGLLTLFRMALIPIFVVTYFIPFSTGNIVATAIFAIAALTDWLDGFLARRWNQTTSFGAFLDPVADKLLVATALVLVVARPYLHYISIPAAIIISREILVSALREWMAEIGNRTSVAVSFIGKCKAFIQMAALLLLVYCSAPHSPVGLTVAGYILLYVATTLTLWSMMMYIKAAWPDIVASDK